jgi:type IV pilus assembly protein PilC
MIEAGVPLVNALRTMQRNAPGALRLTANRLAERCQGGVPLHEAMADTGMKFDRLDIQTVTVSERSGALDAGMKALARYHDMRALARRKILGASLLPGVILVAAVFISRAPKLVTAMFGQGDYSPARYLLDTVGLLAGVAGVLVAAWWMLRWMYTVPGLNLTVERLVRSMPVVGRLRFDYALSQWLSAMRMMLNAGMGVIESLELASRNCPSPMIRDAHARMTPLLHSSMEASEALRSTGVFPEDLLQMWATGEQSGRMDDMLDRMARAYEDRWRRSVEVFAAWLPRVAYVAVSFYVVWQIFRMLEPLFQLYQDALTW